MRKTFCALLLLTVLISGCLETKEAWPAIISKPVLKEQGWTSFGDMQKQSQTQNIAGMTVKLNMALMNYRDDALVQDIIKQIQELSSTGQIKDTSQFTSQLITVRLVLPAGISLPSEVVSRIMGSQLEQIASQNNIRDFNETDSTKTTLIDGKEVTVKNYKGIIDIKGGSIKIRGMMASWSGSGSTIIVFGVLPAENIVITPMQGEPVSIKINGEQEYQEMMTLLQNVE